MPSTTTEIIGQSRKNYWQRRDPKDFSPAQKEFIDLLNKAIDRVGGQEIFASILSNRTSKTVHVRKVQYWLNGVGPSRPARDKALPVIRNIAAGR